MQPPVPDRQPSQFRNPEGRPPSSLNLYELQQEAVRWGLRHNNAVEYALNLIACTWPSLVRGNPEGARAMLARRPPNSGDLLPGCALTDARTVSKTPYQEAERRTHGWGAVGANVPTQAPPVNEGASAARRRPAAKAKVKAGPKSKATTKAVPAAKSKAAPATSATSGSGG